jgi:DNA polymerase elongation subunit (family B)
MYDNSVLLSLVGVRSTKQATGKIQDYVDFILEMREYDVPYHVRFAIDNGWCCCTYVS